jgi:hypothetical protein
VQMKRKSFARSAFLTRQFLVGLCGLLAGVGVAMFANAFAKPASTITQRQNVKPSLHGAAPRQDRGLVIAMACEIDVRFVPLIKAMNLLAIFSEAEGIQRSYATEL